jgi:translation initiation factor IF-2
MAKVRAYKLAEELKLERDEFIEKANEAGIEIRSPMSALDDETVALVRSKLGAGVQVVTQEKRVGGTVIRRRRKAKAPPVAPEPVEAEAAAAEAAVPEPLAAVEGVPEEVPVVAEAEPGAAEEAEAPEAPSELPPAAASPEPQPGALPTAAGAARMTTPVKVVEDPLAGYQPPARPAAAAAGAAAGAGAVAEPGQPGAEPSRGGRPGAPGEQRGDDRRPAPRKIHRRAQIVQGQNLKEQETMARMMRGNVQAHLEKRRMVVEQQSRLQSPRKRGAKKKKPLIIGERSKVLRLGSSTSITELSKELGVKVRDLQRRARDLELDLEREAMLDLDTATLLSGEYGFEVARIETETEKAVAAAGHKDEQEGEPRPPVVTVMGHVDHGKTSLLDAIRETRVVEGEAGGITQHIGAYQVRAGGQDITFIDTPGHAAFTQMRARGAQVTDLVVLVIAADDGVMPQTVEAINHAKAAGVPIIIAVNKIDKANANPQRAKQALLEHELVVEEFGGDVLSIEVSATAGTNIDKLLEAIGLQSEVLELRSPSKGAARAIVIEASLDKGRGPVTSVLVQEGTLKRGDAVVVGTEYGRVRSLIDDRGENLKEAGPAVPVQILGLGGVPEAGDELVVMKNEREAKRVAEHRLEEQKREAVQAPSPSGEMSVEDLFAQLSGGEGFELNVVLKADVRGTVEATKEALEKLSTEKVELKVLHAGVGAISESDVMLAAASRAVILGFHVRPEAAARKAGERDGVEIRCFDIVYELLDEAQLLMQGMLPAKRIEKVVASLRVKELFHVPKVGTIAGCEVQEGTIKRSSRARVVRDGVQVYDGQLASLRRFKDDVREVSAPLECGLGIEHYNDIKVGDIIEAYEVEEKQDTL